MTERKAPVVAITRRELVAGAVTAAALAGTGIHPAAAAPARASLRLLATTDLHVNVLPYDYYRDRPDDTVGLAKTATLVKAARAEAKNSVLFDTGDLLQ